MIEILISIMMIKWIIMKIITILVIMIHIIQSKDYACGKYKYAVLKSIWKLVHVLEKKIN